MATQETAWTTYWQANRLDSCIVRQGHQEEDAQAIFEFWQAFAAEMPEGSNLLDLATGNGAVAFRLLEAAKRMGKEISINAVDLADIRPEAFLRDYGEQARLIDFHGHVDICALPFADQSFDGVVSQFGFEYADQAKAVSELVRVLKPGGRFQFLMHHTEGALVAPNVAQIAEIDALLRQGGLVDLIEQFLAGKAQMDMLEQEGRQLLDANDNQLPRITAEIFDAVRQLLMRRDLDLSVRQQGAADMHRRLDAEQERMQQLSQAALSESGAESLCRSMTSAGLQGVACQPFHVGADSVLLGWRVNGHL